MIGIKMII